MINPEIAQLLKFHLINGTSKFPGIEWKTCNKHLWNKNKHITGHKNYGIPTGKKNNIILLDLDFYKWEDNHPFYELCKKEDLEKYLKAFKTITVRTGHDGWHLWFKYNTELRTRDNHQLNIDIKSDGGYGVGPCSKMIKEKNKAPYNEVGKIGYYREIWKDTNTNLQDMPKELINWLKKYQQIGGSKKIKPTKNQIITSNNYLEKEQNHYNYNINDEKLKEIINKLPNTLWEDFDEWFKITTAFKALNKKKIWDLESKKHQGYNKLENEKIWKSIKSAHNSMNLVNWLLHQTNDRTLLDYIKYKPIPENKLKESNYKYEKINRQKLGKIEGDKNDNNYVKLENYNDVFIRSDTGTGKTTLLKKYIYKTNQPVISIVSRVSLADSHYNDFQKQGINIHNYHIAQDKWYFNTGESVVITIESIRRISDLDFSNYVVFLDEYDSLIKHLIKSPTLNSKTTYCWKVLRRLIKECKQIIAVDADIHSDRMKFIKDLGRDITIIENEYKHNKGVKMRELYKYQDFINECNKVDDKLVCCDSKTDAEIIFKEIIKKNDAKPIIEGDDKNVDYQIYECKKGKTYALITSETDEYIDLDDHDIVVFSPKIIYGLDSLRKRPVFSHYKEHTINPRAMLQQVARCRNIVELVFIFYKKKFNTEKYTIRKDVKKEFDNLKEYTRDFKELLTDDESNLYEEMLIDLEYEEDCYYTNKYAHFRNGALEKGFIEEIKAYQTEAKILIEKEKEHKEEKYDNFNPEDPKYEKINKYLELPSEVMKKNKELFLDITELNNYFNKANFFFKGQYEWKRDLQYNKDFMIKKITNNKNKFNFIIQVFNKLGIKDKTILTPTNKIHKNDADLLWKEYKALWRYRGKDLDLSIEYDQTKWLSGIYRKLFGKNILKEPERIIINGKKLNKYIINEDELYKQRDLMRYKEKHIPSGKIDFRIGYEFEINKEKIKKRHKKVMKYIINDIEDIAYTIELNKEKNNYYHKKGIKYVIHDIINKKYKLAFLDNSFNDE